MTIKNNGSSLRDSTHNAGISQSHSTVSMRASSEINDGAWNCQRQETKDNSTAEAALPPLELDTIERLVVFHLRDSVTTPFSIRSDQLEKIDIAERFETSDPQDIFTAHMALRADRPVLDREGNVDARWLVQFIGKEGEPRFGISIDRFGVQGEIQQEAFRFTNLTFVEWLEARFGV